MKKTAASQGYTLTELATVLVVMGVVVGAGAPFVSGYFRSNNLEQSLDSLASQFDMTRHRAIAERNPFEVIIGEPAENQFLIHDDDNGDGIVNGEEGTMGPFDLPKGMTFTGVELSGDQKIVFQPTGMLRAGQGGSFQVCDGNGRYGRLELFASGSVNRVE